MEINYKNVFIVNLFFGFTNSHQTVIAKDLEEACETIQDYYDEPVINYIFSVDELKDLLIKIGNNYIVVELIMEGKTINRKAYEEKISIYEIKNKYSNRNIFIIDKNMLINATQDIENFINSSKNEVLLSKSFTI